MPFPRQFDGSASQGLKVGFDILQRVVFPCFRRARADGQDMDISWQEVMCALS